MTDKFAKRKRSVKRYNTYYPFVCLAIAAWNVACLIPGPGSVARYPISVVGAFVMVACSILAAHTGVE